MALVAKDDGGGFKMVPTGMHVARCYRVLDLGTQENVKWNKFQHKCMIALEIYGDECKTEDGRPLSISMWHTVSLGEKANLRKDLESWRGRPFSAEELKGFRVDQLLGAPAMINVIHNESGGKVYANIASISPVPKGMHVPEPVNEPQLFDFDSPNAMTVFETLPDGLQDIIKRSIEWHRLQGGDPGKAAVAAGQRASQQATAASNPDPNLDDMDDDIPF